ncbi:hypothetical protein KUA55_10165 [Enterococcus sp. ALS3]|uniref:DUF1366 domain-containing protein n=1 Tax=Enterococcus alishanensis TaxID=1303817 RepID=A0ABS6TDT6_9ENTE|nr:hypothetical protein [Enterococcus alishanensis]MBV7391046.1 hypothetical protein [Enterococcus alishanensis]
MKTIYKVLYPIGFETVEVGDTYEAQVPYTEVAPLVLKNEQSQFFDFPSSKWEEATTQDVSKQLKLLESLSTGIQKENAELKEKQINLDAQLTDAQIAIAEVFEIVAGGEANG